ncbi:hypothetical protein [Bradyrhizobium japonicum]|uniref:hypothetical protein n=1 Tax=Bradyrhizobium japonicum TaxID=375 RepID=UPI001BAE2CFF|nr:hypothetical protein [Bradyrhizobium japonicum]MBR0766008.1 hypothetical protein [Bradyrhizobium japonicum]
MVDDDPFGRGSLSSLFRSVRLKKVKALASAAELLEIITRSGNPAGVFNLVAGSGSTSSSGSPMSSLRVCANCCPANGNSRAKPTNPPISCLTFTERYHSATRLSRTRQSGGLRRAYDAQHARINRYR